MTQSKQHGGTEGKDFSDEALRGKIKSITVRHGRYVDAIEITYAGKTPVTHGGDTGPFSHTINFADDEQIVAVFGRCGTYVDDIGFVTMKDGVMRQYGPYGGKKEKDEPVGGKYPFCIVGKVEYFFGNAGKYLFAIGIGGTDPIVDEPYTADLK